jgi:hypothetical protein
MWAIAGIGVLVAVSLVALPRVTVPAAGLRTRLSVLVRPSVTRVLVITTVALTASFAVFVYLPVLAASAAPGATISWVLMAFGVGSVAGNWFAADSDTRRSAAIVGKSPLRTNKSVPTVNTPTASTVNIPILFDDDRSVTPAIVSYSLIVVKVFGRVVP